MDKKKKNNQVRRIILVTFLGIFLLSFVYFSLNRKAKFGLRFDSEYVFGIDVSHYQKSIDWLQVKDSHHPIKFVIVRSTMGIDGKDTRFATNWNKTKEMGFIRGAYHYYRPDEDPVAQFNNFASRVHLKEGDLPPILDIEDEGNLSKDDLNNRLKIWLDLAENHYGIKPVIYAPQRYFRSFLPRWNKDYHHWIPDYYKYSKAKLLFRYWAFHQFSERFEVEGINENVDGNHFNGTLEDLKALCIGDDLKKINSSNSSIVPDRVLVRQFNIHIEALSDYISSELQAGYNTP